MKIKCDIQYNLAEQTLDVYYYTREHYFVYTGENKIEGHNREGYTQIKPFLKIPYEFTEELEEEMAKRFMSRKGTDISLLDNTAKDSHIKDLRWILTHFIDKDKKSED